MGAKTALLAYVDPGVDVAALLAASPPLDRAAARALLERLMPGRAGADAYSDGTLAGDCYPDARCLCAASWPGLDVVSDRALAELAHSELPARLVEASLGRTMFLHCMNSTVAMLTFAVWRDGRRVRALVLSGSDGCIEASGEPLPFEAPFWSGERSEARASEEDEDDDEDGDEDEDEDEREADEAGEASSPLPFDVFAFSDEALQWSLGFRLEGPEGAFDADSVPLAMFLRAPLP